MFKIPFKYLPASWGLKGKSYATAKAEYELTGYELDAKLCEINGGDESEFIDLKIKHGKINKYSGECEKIRLKFDPSTTDYKLAILELNANEGIITRKDFERFRADLLDEPYITVLESSYDPASGSSGLVIEFDWNKQWIDLLVSEGYSGRTEDDIIQSWFNELLKTMAVESVMADPTNFNPSRVVSTTSDGNNKVFR